MELALYTRTAGNLSVTGATQGHEEVEGIGSSFRPEPKNIHTIHTKTRERRTLRVAFVEVDEICGSPQHLDDRRI